MTSPISGFRPPTTVQTQTTARTQTSTTSRTAPADSFSAGSRSGSEATRAAADAAISRLRNINSITADGDTFNVSEFMSPADLASERGSYEDRINALANQQPPLSPAALTAQADQMIGEYEQLMGALGAAIQNMIVMMAMNNQNLMSQALQNAGV